MSDHHHEEHHHEPTYGTPILVFLGLVGLTCITVASSALKLSPATSLVLAMAIASVKASLVAYFFMHLKYEKSYFFTFFWVAVVTLAIIFIWTFSDYPFRNYN